MEADTYHSNNNNSPAYANDAGHYVLKLPYMLIPAVTLNSALDDEGDIDEQRVSTKGNRTTHYVATI